jgi:enoyl-CoA hydratase/carnithine racemase
VKWCRDDNDVVELELDHPPCNEIGLEAMDRLEAFVGDLQGARAVVIHSARPGGFCAGADLRQLYRKCQELDADQRAIEIRDFLSRIHAVLSLLDALPAPTFAAVHGVCFGGGLELALACDMIIADKTARFAFPELRLGLIPGFGGIPRLRRDVSNSLVRDLLLTGRSINATRAHQAGLVAQVAGEGEALRAARAAAAQAVKFDTHALAAAKRWIKPVPQKELLEEIEIFLGLFERPAVQEALRRFVEDEGPMPYLP